MAIHITRLNGGDITVGSSGGGSSGHADTWYKYAGDTEWRTVSISGAIEGIFDDIFERYTTKAELMDVRTTAMGSLYRLNYKVVIRSKVSTKSMLDEMRERNGNLEIICSRSISSKTEEL